MITSTDKDQMQAMANVTHPCIFYKPTVFSTTSKNNTWIIDTGASDHMTRDSNQLQYVRSSSQSVISTANGSTSPITEEGSVILYSISTTNLSFTVG